MAEIDVFINAAPISVEISGAQGPGVGVWGSITGNIETQTDLVTYIGTRLVSGEATAKNVEVFVRNTTGATITKGSIVYINGASGNRPTITKARANNDANSAQTIGFVKDNIDNNATGYVITSGDLENVNTNGLGAGTQLYLSPATAGAWTTTKPSAPSHLVYVGIVVVDHPNQGIIYVSIQNGYEIEELHDVAISSPLEGQLLRYSSTTGLWSNQTLPTSTGGNAADDAGKFVIFGGDGEIIASSNSVDAAYFISATSTGLRAASVSGDYHAEFGYFDSDVNDKAFIKRTDGAFGWVRSAHEAIIYAAKPLTDSRAYVLPNASGDVVLDSTLGSTLGTLTGTVTASGNWAFSSAIRPTSAASVATVPAANSLITRADGDLRYNQSFFSRGSLEIIKTDTTPVTAVSIPIQAGLYRIKAKTMARVAVNGSTGGGMRMLITGVTFSNAAGKTIRYGAGSGVITPYTVSPSGTSIGTFAAAAEYSSTVWSVGVFNEIDIVANCTTGTLNLQVHQWTTSANPTIFEENYSSLHLELIS